jgi:hypothetical protein
MPKRHSAEPFVRWADDASNDDVKRDLGNLFRAVRPAEAMSPAELEATRRRLARSAVVRSRRSRVPSIALVACLLLGGASAALAEWARPGWWHLRSEVLAPPLVRQEIDSPVAPAADLPARPAPSQVSEPLDELPPVAVSPPAPNERAATPAAVEPKTESAPAGAPAGPSRSALALESESLQRALVALRREHDARSALALLDEHEARFPRGELGLEAAAARVDALLLLGRRADALSRLERMPLEGAGPRADLLLLRAEIRADSDCPRAIADFDKVLAKRAAPAIDERALYGRAACRLRTGDGPGAEADLRTYLARYPAGRFADEVRARLPRP